MSGDGNSMANAIVNAVTPEIAAPSTCYIVRVSTGCTCCSYENFMEGPWRTREAAAERAAAHIRSGTLSSQYAPTGRAEVIEIPFVRAGEWIILDEKYAVRGDFLEDNELSWPDELQCFRKDNRL